MESIEEEPFLIKEFSVTGKVIFFEPYAQFLIKVENSHPQLGFELFEFDETETYQVLELEVIGNIYENPSLLEVQYD